MSTATVALDYDSDDDYDVDLFDYDDYEYDNYSLELALASTDYLPVDERQAPQATLPTQSDCEVCGGIAWEGNPAIFEDGKVFHPECYYEGNVW
jgi:hypothetical protein